MEVTELRLNTIASKEEPDPQTRRHRIHCKQELIVNSLQRFYSQQEELSNIVELLKGSGEMSLRLIDWFVTNYSKQFSISYILKGQEFVVYMNYKSQLKAYSKKLFDPFCRRERILFQVPGHEAFLTTVGKLNFFRWAIEKGVLDHIKTHQAVIEKHMNEAMREQTKQRTTLSKKVDKVADVAPQIETRSVNQTRRRSAMKDTTQGKALQKHTCVIEMRFD